jgi:peptidyl-prolyl cis-trans isomerase A (cyclophilin A)
MRAHLNLLIFMIIPLLAQARPAPKYYCESDQKAFRAVDLETVLGPIRIALFDSHAPITTENFVYYVNQGFYDNTVVHQIDRRFVLQAGLYDANFVLKPPLRDPIMNESGNKIKHRAMRVAMWRSERPDSATSAFFINLNDNPTLNIPQGYAVFGEVIEGKDRLKRMQYQMMCQAIDKPDADCRPIIIHSAKLVNVPCTSHTEASS